MPDRLPPSWGREPEDGRDLGALLPAQAPLSDEELLADEALLSGQMTGISESQRPVAGAMFALRSAPVWSELAGEAAARAAFRALLEPAGAVSHHTLVLPVQAPVPAAGQGHGPRSPARHRHRRSAARGRGWQVMAAIGSAAAVVTIGVAALAGAFSGSTVQQRQQSSPTAAQMSTPHGVGSTPAGVLGNATKDATPSATPKASATPGTTASPQAASRGSALCREYFSFDHQADMGARRKLFRELSRLAGTDSFAGVYRYCTEQQDTHLFTMPPEPTSTGGSWPWLQGDGGQGNGNGGADSGAGTGQAGSGNSTSGPGISGHGSSDSGSRNSR